MSDTAGNYDLFRRDIHAHSGYSKCYWPGCGKGTLDELYSYARDATGLDFCATTDHDTHMTDGQWEVTRKKAAAHNEPGRFVTFTAYEWTSYGYRHRNVYYLTDSQDGRSVPLAGAVGRPAARW